MNLLQLFVLAVIQGLAELLPVSSSAHVIVAAKLMGLDPASPPMTLLLVMLHSGTMFAVIVYFWTAWRETYFSSFTAFRRIVPLLFFSTLLTGMVGYPIKLGIEKIALRHVPNAEIEMIFGNLILVAVALATAGCLIIYAGLCPNSTGDRKDIGWREAGWMGAIQGLCLPFRGFSRSGATISTGLILGASKSRLEEYSFALAVIITPPVVAREVLRVLAARSAAAGSATESIWHLFAPGLTGLVLSFFAGLIALRWLSRWLEHGRWHFFGVYCLGASVVVFILHQRNF